MRGPTNKRWCRAARKYLGIHIEELLNRVPHSDIAAFRYSSLSSSIFGLHQQFFVPAPLANESILFPLFYFLSLSLLYLEKITLRLNSIIYLLFLLCLFQALQFLGSLGKSQPPPNRRPPSTERYHPTITQPLQRCHERRPQKMQQISSIRTSESPQTTYRESSNHSYILLRQFKNSSQQLNVIPDRARGIACILSFQTMSL